MSKDCSSSYKCSGGKVDKSPVPGGCKGDKVCRPRKGVYGCNCKPGFVENANGKCEKGMYNIFRLIV